MKIAVIGAGITGLTAAYELSNNGHQVELYEKDSCAGGIAGTFDYNGYKLEKYYHHFFKSDTYIMKLLKELGISNKVSWYYSKMGFFMDNRCYDFGTPISLLKLKPLHFKDKLKFGIAILKILADNNWEDLEEITASQWILKNAGNEAYNKIWKPLLLTKFSDQYNEVAMSWLWGKIKLRGSSKENGREVLGYIDGSEQLLLDALIEKLSERGVKLHFNSEVYRITRDNSLKIACKGTDREFDRVVCTAPLPVFLASASEILPQGYYKGLQKTQHTAVCCTIFIMDRQFTPYYWLNIGDETIPFGGLIEHTNLISPEEYGGDHILYISNYLDKNSPYYSMNSKQLLDEYIPYLKKINPNFKRQWVKDVINFKDEYAQPIIKKDYSRVRPDYKTPVQGLYIANMCSIYPEDRGVNYAIREGRRCAAEAMK